MANNNLKQNDITLTNSVEYYLDINGTFLRVKLSKSSDGKYDAHLQKTRPDFDWAFGRINVRSNAGHWRDEGISRNYAFGHPWQGGR